MPDKKKNLRTRDLAELTGLHLTTVRKKVREDPTLPKPDAPESTTRSHAWIPGGPIAEWIQENRTPLGEYHEIAGRLLRAGQRAQTAGAGQALAELLTVIEELRGMDERAIAKLMATKKNRPYVAKAQPVQERSGTTPARLAD